jgi:hypothetical protein
MNRFLGSLKRLKIQPLFSPQKQQTALLFVLQVFVSLGIVSGEYPLEEGPLSQMSEAVNNIDPHTPYTPGMPATPHTPGTGHRSPRSANGSGR